MEDEAKPAKKKRIKKETNGDASKDFQALAKFTSSDVIRQVKAGLSRIAPLEPEGDEAIPTTEDPQP
ncbi:MAG: hypothetical protein A2992_07685 [Elusimicrobia bacterium RIFCSPLOWO2_01_FULL_59_12]|nr:MAG: hypothetical protein A2992_07685 [Elusimicrobia bacterium RIFCSPLOWO2_01_FULL_59_12]